MIRVFLALVCAVMVLLVPFHGRAWPRHDHIVGAIVWPTSWPHETQPRLLDRGVYMRNGATAAETLQRWDSVCEGRAKCYHEVVPVESNWWGCFGYARFAHERDGKRWEKIVGRGGSMDNETDAMLDVGNSVRRYITAHETGYARHDEPSEPPSKVKFLGWHVSPVCVKGY